MIHLEKILMPTDLSENSKAPLEYALALADKFDAEMHLLHVIQDAASLIAGPDGFYSVPEGFYQEMRDDAVRRLDEFVEPARRPGKGVVREIKEGAPFVEIIRYARKQGIDLIVMGTHGRSGLSHLLIGSVAERVVRKAPCPVLTVHPPEFEFTVP